MIRTYRGRADLYLYVNGIKRDYSLSFTKNKIWQDVKLHFVTKLKKGKHSFALRSNKANAFGCGGSWGDIDILVLPEKMTAVLAKDSTEPKKTTPKKPKTTKKMCPKVAIKCKCGHTYTMVKGCSMPKCKTCTTPKKVKTTPKKPTIKVTYKFAFNGCCRGTRASSWKLQGVMEAQYCTKRCTEDKNCNAVEVNGCRKNQCKGKCWHFYGDAKGTLTNGGCQTNGDMKCYAKSTSTMSTKLILKRIVGKTSNTQAKDSQIVYLDRHDVDARAGGVLTSFKFTGGGGNRMYYQYTYVKFPASTVGKLQQRYTNYNDGPFRNLEYLDRHNVDAAGKFKNGKCDFLNEFRLQRSGNKIRYRFKVIAAPCTGKCNFYYTGCNTIAGQKIHYLDRHYVNVPAGYGITRFQLGRFNCKGNSQKFLIRACQFKTK
jgi:hypothetical protein